MVEQNINTVEKDLSYNRGYGYQEEEGHELWVADFGSQDVEDSLRQELAKIKPKAPKYISWALTALGLLVGIVVWESLIRRLAQSDPA